MTLLIACIASAIAGASLGLIVAALCWAARENDEAD